MGKAKNPRKSYKTSCGGKSGQTLLASFVLVPFVIHIKSIKGGGSASFFIISVATIFLHSTPDDAGCKQHSTLT